jgi:hypothetical protein
MCTVLIRFRPGTAEPLWLGAVRDEFADRPWDPPAAHWGDHLLGGLDRTAGGTWLAVDPDRPAVAALLNGKRLPPPPDGNRPSRGSLPLAALRGQPLPDALPRYDGFHLVFATPSAVRVWTWDGAGLTERLLDAGEHIIVNAGIVDAGIDVAGIDVADPKPDLGGYLVDRIYKGRRYASTSLSIVTFEPTGVTYEFNPRPTDPSAWYRVLPQGSAADRNGASSVA